MQDGVALLSQPFDDDSAIQLVKHLSGVDGASQRYAFKLKPDGVVLTNRRAHLCALACDVHGYSWMFAPPGTDWLPDVKWGGGLLAEGFSDCCASLDDFRATVSVGNHSSQRPDHFLKCFKQFRRGGDELRIVL